MGVSSLTGLGKAADAASRLFILGRDLAILKAELQAKRQLRRAVWLSGAIGFFTLFIFFPGLWLTVDLYQRGWSPLELAGLCAAVFGSLSLGSALVGRFYFSPQKTEVSARKLTRKRVVAAPIPLHREERRAA